MAIASAILATTSGVRLVGRPSPSLPRLLMLCAGSLFMPSCHFSFFVRIAMPRKQLSWLQLISLFLLICGVVAMEAQQSMWNQHLARDVGEFWIRTEKYLTFQLQGIRRLPDPAGVRPKSLPNGRH
jgi:hypothetical protein